MSPAADTLTLRRPDDWHVHLRDGPFLRAVIGFTAERFARAIVMPNLAPPVTSLESARAYRRRIVDALPEGARFEPLMTWYLTDDTDPDELAAGFEEGLLTAVKLYPAHATTNSALGVTDMKGVHPVLARLETIGMPLLIHGEVTDPTVDVFDREAVFIDRVLKGLRADFPELKMVLEHVTTEEAVAFVEAQDGRLGATVTPHHLMINRNALFDGGLRPHVYCLPLAKRERHRLALCRAVASGHPAFFLGTDSAPHRIGDKESDCGCAGVFSGPGALEFYAQVFDEEGALDKLEAFASLNGPRFYGLPENEDRVTLVREPSTIPADVHLEGGAGARPLPVRRHRAVAFGRRLSRVAAGLAALGVAACGPDLAQVAVCKRVLAALAESGDTPTVEGSAEADGARPAVVLRYRRGGRSEQITCHYAGGAFERGRLNLTAVRSSESGNLGPVALRVLKRRLNL